jgi:hypothetical protein
MHKGPDGEAGLARQLPAAVKDIVRRQVEVGVDIVDDAAVGPGLTPAPTVPAAGVAAAGPTSGFRPDR